MPPPPNPDYFDKVNYVIDAWAQPCEAPWYIYVSTLKPAALAALITLLTFGWDDVLRGFARPRGLGRGRRTGKKRGKGRIGLRGIPEFGEMLGRQIPGSEGVKGIKWSDGLKTLWRIDTVVQGFLFAWLVADVTIDFGFTWTSLLYETRWCQESARGRFSYQKGTAEVVTADAWNEIAFTALDYKFPFPNWLVTFGVTGVKGATITFSIDWEPLVPGFPPATYSSRLIDKDTGEVLSETGPRLPDGAGNSTHVISAPVGRARRFGVEGFCANFGGLAAGGAILGMEDML